MPFVMTDLRCFKSCSALEMNNDQAARETYSLTVQAPWWARSVLHNRGTLLLAGAHEDAIRMHRTL